MALTIEQIDKDIEYLRGRRYLEAQISTSTGRVERRMAAQREKDRLSAKIAYLVRKKDTLRVKAAAVAAAVAAVVDMRRQRQQKYDQGNDRRGAILAQRARNGYRA